MEKKVVDKVSTTISISIQDPRLTHGGQELFLSVLNSTSTKREAKSYLARFKSPTSLIDQASIRAGRHRSSDELLRPRHGVNLGDFYSQARAVEDGPAFRQRPVAERSTTPNPDRERLHVAVVKLCEPQRLDDATLRGVGRTLSQLSQLGLPAVVVVDCTTNGSDESTQQMRAQQMREWRELVVDQVDRLVSAIEASGQSGARRVDGVLGTWSGRNPTRLANTRLRVTSRDSLIKPLRRGVLPVVTPIGYHGHSPTAFVADADAVLISLTQELAGLSPSLFSSAAPSTVLDRTRALQDEITVDRLIVLDQVGGIPSRDTPPGGHVFINLEEEFADIRRELDQERLRYGTGDGSDVTAARAIIPMDVGYRRAANDTVRSQLASRHLSNLQLLQRALAILPPSSSALLTTPEEAATSGGAAAAAAVSGLPFRASDVGTRRRRNTLIHNLLTDKPPYSSSLPARRLGLSDAVPVERWTVVPTTFVKRGLPLTIVPDPRTEGWGPPGPGRPRVTLHDPRIDLSRLLDLIEDSFGRTLNLKHYLSRVNDRLAGVIIAGEYEGGAILTWETPCGGVEEADEETDHRRRRGGLHRRRAVVPYLDKFAVRKRSQGAGGVADMVFTAMIRSCSPNGGVCWRSRKDNPVNRWYFERARGTWKLSDSNWTMFWTTPDLGLDSALFRDYEGVCRTVEPSWADRLDVLD